MFYTCPRTTTGEREGGREKEERGAGEILHTTPPPHLPPAHTPSSLSLYTLPTTLGRGGEEKNEMTVCGGVLFTACRRDSGDICWESGVASSKKQPSSLEPSSSHLSLSSYLLSQ